MRRWHRYLPNLLRLTAFVVFVLLVSSAIAARALANNLREGLLSLGHQMMLYADGRTLGKRRQLFLNGTALEFAVGSTTDTIAQVMDVYERRCTERGGVFPAPQAPRDGRQVPKPTARPALKPTALRFASEHHGFIACLDVGNAVMTPTEIARRARAALDTGDVSRIGLFRYLYAVRDPEGRTLLVAFWSDTELNVKRMFLETGDVPGQDVPDVPRAPGLLRILSTAEAGLPYGITAYSGSTAREQVERYFATEMVKKGWKLLPLSASTQAKSQGRSFLPYQRGMASVSLLIDGTAGRPTTVTVLTGL